MTSSSSSRTSGAPTLVAVPETAVLEVITQGIYAVFKLSGEFFGPISWAAAGVEFIAPVTSGRAHVAATDTRPWRNASTNSA